MLILVQKLGSSLVWLCLPVWVIGAYHWCNFFHYGQKGVQLSFGNCLIDMLKKFRLEWFFEILKFYTVPCRKPPSGE